MVVWQKDRLLLTLLPPETSIWQALVLTPHKRLVEDGMTHSTSMKSEQ
jgi:hypothetical protein